MERIASLRGRVTEAAKQQVLISARAEIIDFPINYNIIGKENIGTGRELLSEGKILVAALDHRVYADLVTGACIAIKEDFDDLVQVGHIVMRISYLQNFPTNLLPNYFEVLPVVPHTMPDYPKRDEINGQAISTAQNLDDGSLLIVTPEGTRSGQAGMQEARYGAERFWHGRGERWLIPIAIEGTEKQWPKKLGMIAGGAYYILAGRLWNAKFIFGEPVEVEEIDSIAGKLAKNEDDFARLKTEVPMGLIARLHLEKGNPRYAGRYADLARQLQEIRP